MKKFRRMNQNATLGGVCSGFAYQLVFKNGLSN